MGAGHGGCISGELESPAAAADNEWAGMTEQARPKSITDYVTTYGGQGQREWTDTESNNMGISNSNLPKIVNPEKLAQSDKALSKPYYGTKSPGINEPSNYLNETANPIANTRLFYDAIDDAYYVQGDDGSVVINGKKYFPANSAETVYLYPTYNTINYDFQSKKFFELVNAAVPNGYKPLGGDYLYVIRKSTGKGSMNQKNNLDKDTLYLFNGKLYNKNEAGNIIWGAAMCKLGFVLEESQFYGNMGTLVTEKRWDEAHDQRAIEEGWKYMFQVMYPNE